MRNKPITDDLRKRIILGQYACGKALPVRRVLLDEYGVSVATFQKTINALVREGFLESRIGNGVFVRKDLPSKYHLGLILPVDSPVRLTRDSLWEAIFHEGENFSFEGEKIKLIPYFLGESKVVESGELARLNDDIAHGRLCGAIRFRDWPELSLPVDFPCVNMDYSPEITPSFRIRMSTDYLGLFSYSLEKLKAHGIKRAAVIYHVKLKSSVLLQIRENAQKAGIEILPGWFLPLHIGNLESIAYHWQIGELFSQNLKKHPEGLIVLNENLLSTVLSSLNEKSIIPGRDIQIVSHLNHHTGKRWEDSVQYIGFRASDILRATMECIRKWTPESELVVTIPPVVFQ